jgi:Fe-S-cluster-containing hydrogenase component 2
MEGDFPVVDKEEYIDCGVCAVPCPASAVRGYTDLLAL